MSKLCHVCKGKGLCGRPICPIVLRFKNIFNTTQNLNKTTSVFGASPPAVFVGSHMYPKLSAGPLIPPALDFPDLKIGPSSQKLTDKINTFPEFLEDSRMWHDLSIEDIIAIRSLMVRAKSTFTVSDAKTNNTLLTKSQELALSSKPVDTEAWFKKPLISDLDFDGTLAPMGPSGFIKDFKISENPKVPKKVDYIVYDTDASASDSILELSKGRVSNEQISRLMSIGLLGKDRKLVPTRWSITAVDDIQGKSLISEIKDYPHIRDITVFSGGLFGNHFEIMLVPGSFSFEMIEIWMPKAVWSGEKTIIAQDHEDFYGKKSYSSLTGGYYAGRLPILEYMKKIKRQACVFAVREIRPEYYAPLGVWVVREAARFALSQIKKTYLTQEHALSDMQKRIITPRSEWEAAAKLLHNRAVQTRIDSYF